MGTGSETILYSGMDVLDVAIQARMIPHLELEDGRQGPRMRLRYQDPGRIQDLRGVYIPILTGPQGERQCTATFEC